MFVSALGFHRDEPVAVVHVEAPKAERVVEVDASVEA